MTLELPSELRIVLIDDDPDQRLAVTAILAGRGFTNVVQAADAEEGLRVSVDAEPHLILLDLVMPGRSGSDALPDLCEAVPHATIVVLSNMPRRRVLSTVLRRGAAGFVEKATAPDRLVDEILIAATLTDLARTHVLGLPSTPASAGHARRFARELIPLADRAFVGDIELIVSELVTNTLVHTRGAPRLEVHVLRTGVRVEVHDDDPTAPAPRTPDADRPGGRGLQLLARLSSRWGVETTASGKVVWAEIDHPIDAAGLLTASDG